MALGKKDIFTPTKGTQANKSKKIKQEHPQETFKRHTYYLKQSLIEKVDSYAYWERLNKSDIVNIALEKFLKGKKVKPVPKK